MSRRVQRPRRARLAAAILGIGALLLTPVVASAGSTEAAWLNAEYASTTVQTPTVTIAKGSCTLSNPNLAGPQYATVTWSYPPASTTVVQPNSVTYLVTNTANGAIGFGPSTVGVSGSPLSPTAFTIGVGGGAAGTYALTVTPTRNTWATGSTASWTGPAATFSLVIAQGLLGRYFSSCT